MVTFIVGNSEPDAPIPGPPSTPEGFPPLSRGQIEDPNTAGDIDDGTLIPGLVDDLAMLVLARVPRWDHATCRAVARPWRAAYESERLYELRRTHGLQEEWVHVSIDDPLVCGEVFDPRTARWQRLPFMPVEPQTHSLCNFRSVSLGADLYIIGGVEFDARSYPVDVPIPSARVYKYSMLTRRWSRLSDMHHARGSFACAAMGGQIFVAGGSSRHSSFRVGGEVYRHVEVYSPAGDTWRVLGDLAVGRAEAYGAVISGKLHIVGGYGTGGNQRGMIPVYYNDLEIYDPQSDTWTRRPPWYVVYEPPPHVPHGPRLTKFAVLAGQLYALLATALLQYSPESNSWQEVAAQAGGGGSWGGGEMREFVALAGELYVLQMAARWRQGERRCIRFSPAAGRWAELRPLQSPPASPPRERRPGGSSRGSSRGSNVDRFLSRTLVSYSSKWACSCIVSL